MKKNLLAMTLLTIGLMSASPKGPVNSSIQMRTPENQRSKFTRACEYAAAGTLGYFALSRMLQNSFNTSSIEDKIFLGTLSALGYKLAKTMIKWCFGTKDVQNIEIISNDTKYTRINGRYTQTVNGITTTITKEVFQTVLKQINDEHNKISKELNECFEQFNNEFNNVTGSVTKLFQDL